MIIDLPPLNKLYITKPPLQLNTHLLEPLLSSSLKPQGNESLEAKFYLAGNPWTCNCQTVLKLQEFIGK